MAAAGVAGTVAEAAAGDALECLSAAAVAARLGISKSQVYTLARRGALPHVKLGTGVVFPRRQLEEHIRREAERSVSGGQVERLEDRRRRDVRRRRI